MWTIGWATCTAVQSHVGKYRSRSQGIGARVRRNAARTQPHTAGGDQGVHSTFAACSRPRQQLSDISAQTPALQIAANSQTA